MAAHPSAQTHPPTWYIQAAGRAWGPYPYSRMAEFVREGRLSPSSLVGAQPGGPFGAAEFRRELLALFAPAMPGGVDPAREHTEPVRPQPQRPQPASPVQTPTIDEGHWPGTAEADMPGAVAPQPTRTASASVALVPARAMVVWAELASLTPARFEAVLAAYGPYTAIRPGLWLVQARMSASALRNALSRRLRTGDALLVMQAPLEHVAWFNLAPTAERDIRHLWGGSAG